MGGGKFGGVLASQIHGNGGYFLLSVCGKGSLTDPTYCEFGEGYWLHKLVAMVDIY